MYTAPVHQVVMLVLEKKCPKSITVKLVFINKNDSVAQYSSIYALVRFFCQVTVNNKLILTNIIVLFFR